MSGEGSIGPGLEGPGVGQSPFHKDSSRAPYPASVRIPVALKIQLSDQGVGPIHGPHFHQTAENGVALSCVGHAHEIVDQAVPLDARHCRRPLEQLVGKYTGGGYREIRPQQGSGFGADAAEDPGTEAVCREESCESYGETQCDDQEAALLVGGLSQGHAQGEPHVTPATIRPRSKAM